MENIVGRSFEQSTNGLKDTDGTWKVTVTVSERITTDGENWETESISAMGMDKSFDEAHKVALRSVLQWLEEYVYSRGFDNLVFAMKAQKEQDSNGETLTNTN